MSINRVLISGNLTKDGELRSTSSGTQVLGFGVAVNDRRKNAHTGEWEDYPNFVDCTMFGNRAGSIAMFMKKGTKVAIEGKLRYSKWQDNAGNNRSKLEVVVDEIEFLSAKNQQPAQPQGYAPQQYQQPQAYAPQQYAAPQPMQPMQAQQMAPQPMQPMQAQQMAPQQAQPIAQASPVQQAVQAAQAMQPQLYDEDIPF